MTAVEWLIENLPQRYSNALMNEGLFQQAKEMEKQQTEISDEEIEKELNKRFAGNIPDAVIYKNCFRMGAKWYREQLKKK